MNYYYKMEFNPEITNVLITNMNDTIKNIYQELEQMKQTIIEQQQKITEHENKIIEQEKKILLQDKQITFIKKLVGTVSNVFQTKQVPEVPDLRTCSVPKPTELETKKPRKSNKEIYKLGTDVITCDTCNIKIRRDSKTRHEKTKTHLKQLDLTKF